MKLTRSALLAFALPVCLAGVVFAQGNPAPTDKPAEKQATPAEKPKDQKDEKAQQPAAEKYVYVKMSTSMGDITIELNNEKAPISTANFLSYVDSGFYSNTCFHRVIDGFMIQGGGFSSDLKQKPTSAPIKNEWQNGLKNSRGTIAMARTAAPDSATSQFFINVADNAMLDKPNGGAAYAVFGKVVAGMDVVDKIKAVKTGQKTVEASDGAGGTRRVPFQDVPNETVEVKGVMRLSADEAAKFAPKDEKAEEKKEAPKDGK